MNAVLVNKKVVPVDDLLTWAKWYETANRHVADDLIGPVRVSTVFLGLDHGFLGRQLWFETMIFGGEHDGWQDRYETWEQAEAGHRRALEMLTGRH
jgi:hypothetical protein